MAGRPIAEAKVRIRVDDTEFREELRADITAAVAGQKATVRVDADTGRARADIDETAHDRRTTIDVHADTRAADASIGSLKANLLALGAVTSAPLGATALGGILGLGAGAGVAATGIGAFAAGAIPSIKGVITAQQQLTAEQKAYNLAVAEGNKSAARDALIKEKQTLQGLTAEQRSALVPLHDLSQAYKQFGQAVSPQAIGFFTEALKTATSLLPAITPLAKAAGGALGGLFHQLDTGAKSPAFRTFIHEMAVEAPPIITSFGHILGNLGVTVGHIFVNAGPLITSVLHGLEGATGVLARFTDSPQFKSFIAYAAQEAPIVGRDLAALAGAVIQISGALAPFGDIVIRLIGPLAHLAGDLAPLAPLILGVYTASRALFIWDKLAGLASALAVGFRGVGAAGAVAATGEAEAGAAASSALGPLGLVLGALALVISQSRTAQTALADLLAGHYSDALYTSSGGTNRIVLGALGLHDSSGATTAAVGAGVLGSAANIASQNESGARLDHSGRRANAAAAAAAARKAAADAQQKQLNDLLNQTLTGAGIPAASGRGGGAGSSGPNYVQQITSGLQASIAQGIPGVQAAAARLHATIINEFRGPKNAAERQAALALLATDTAKALEQARPVSQANAKVLGDSITKSLVSAVQQGAPAVQAQLDALRKKILDTLTQPAQARERQSLLAYLQRELTGLGQAAPQVSALTTQLATLKTQLTNTQSAATSFHSSILSALTVNIGGALTGGPTGGAIPITAFLGQQLSQLQTFQGLLGQAKGAGASSALISQLAQLGPSGNKAIQQLLTSGGVGQASSLLDAIDSINATIADQTTQDIYSPQLDTLNGQISTVSSQLDALIAAVERTAKQTGTTVAQGLNGVGKTSVHRGTVSTRPKGRAKIK